MANRFKLSKKGFAELRNSAAIQADMLDKAQTIARKAESMAAYHPAEFTADVQPGKERAHAMVKAVNHNAYRSSYGGNKVLTAALDAGRG